MALGRSEILTVETQLTPAGAAVVGTDPPENLAFRAGCGRAIEHGDGTATAVAVDGKAHGSALLVHGALSTRTCKARGACEALGWLGVPDCSTQMDRRAPGAEVFTAWAGHPHFCLPDGADVVG